MSGFLALSVLFIEQNLKCNGNFGDLKDKANGRIRVKIPGEWTWDTATGVTIGPWGLGASRKSPWNFDSSIAFGHCTQRISINSQHHDERLRPAVNNCAA
jgi:hypothetical protein